MVGGILSAEKGRGASGMHGVGILSGGAGYCGVIERHRRSRGGFGRGILCSCSRIAALRRFAFYRSGTVAVEGIKPPVRVVNRALSAVFFVVLAATLLVLPLCGNIAVREAMAGTGNITANSSANFICNNGTDCWLFSGVQISGNFPGNFTLAVTGSERKLYNCGTVINSASGPDTGGILAKNGSAAHSMEENGTTARNMESGVVRLSNDTGQATVETPAYGMAASGCGSTIYNYGSVFVCGSAAAASYFVGIYANGSGAWAYISGNTSTSGQNGYGAYVQNSAEAVISGKANITTAGNYARGVFAQTDANVTIGDGTNIKTSGGYAGGVLAEGASNAEVGSNVSITTLGSYAHGITAQNGSTAMVDGGVRVTTSGGYAQGVLANASSHAAINNSVSVGTAGNYAHGVSAQGNSSMTVNNTVKVTTAGDYALGLLAQNNSSMAISNTVNVTTAGDYAHGISAQNNSSTAISNTVTATTAGDYAHGISAQDGSTIAMSGGVGVTTCGSFARGVSINASSSAMLSNNVSIATTGSGAYGISAQNSSSVAVSDDTGITTTGGNAHGLLAETSSCATVSNRVSIATSGSNAHGIYVNDASCATIADVISITTGGDYSRGVAVNASSGVVISGAVNVATAGINAHGVSAQNGSSVTMGGNVGVATSGANAHGVFLQESSSLLNCGTITVGGADSHGLLLGLVAGAPSCATNHGTINATGVGSYGVYVANGTFIQAEGSVSGITGAICATDGSLVRYSAGLLSGAVRGDALSILEVDPGSGVGVAATIEGFSRLEKSGAGTLHITGNSTFGSLSFSAGTLVIAGNSSAAALSISDGDLAISRDTRLSVGGNYTQTGGRLVLNPTNASYYQLEVNGTTFFSNSSLVYVNTGCVSARTGTYVYAVTANTPDSSFLFSHNNTDGTWVVTTPQWVWDAATNQHQLRGTITKRPDDGSLTAGASAAYGHQGGWAMMDAVNGRVISRCLSGNFLASSAGDTMTLLQTGEEVVSPQLDNTAVASGGTTFYAMGMGSSGRKDPSSGSAAGYTVSQYGAYVGLERALSNNLIVGTFYGYTQRYFSFDGVGMDEEHQRIQTVGATYGYSSGGWYITDVLSLSVGKHMAERTWKTVSDNYDSYDIRNDINVGYGLRFGKNVQVSPRVGVSVDYVGVGEHNDSAGTVYEKFGQVFAQVLGGVSVRGDYEISRVGFSPFLDLSYSALLVGREVKVGQISGGGSVVTLKDEADDGRLAVEIGADIGVGLTTVLRCAYTGSFSASSRVNGGSLSLRLADLDTELSLGYTNSYSGGNLGRGDASAFLGVKVAY